MLKVTGHDQAIIGVGYAFGRQPVLIYSVEKIIEDLMDMGMGYPEAREFFEYNIIGSGFKNEAMPIFLEPWDGVE